MRWDVVVPVKLLTVAKSRLGAYGDGARQQLALAFAADVVLAARHCQRVRHVLVVTDDTLATATLAALGAQITPDPAAAGLNAALRHGAELIGTERLGRADRPGREGRRGVVTISSDLPAMGAADLDAVLARLPGQHRAFVADTDNRGTTLLAAPHGLALDPAFGPGSRQRHRDSGAVEVDGRPALRRDVDTPEDLAAACGLGVGPHTRAVLRTLGAAPVHLDGAR